MWNSYIQQESASIVISVLTSSVFGRVFWKWSFSVYQTSNLLSRPSHPSICHCETCLTPSTFSWQFCNQITTIKIVSKNRKGQMEVGFERTLCYEVCGVGGAWEWGCSSADNWDNGVGATVGHTHYDYIITLNSLPYSGKFSWGHNFVLFVLILSER